MDNTKPTEHVVIITFTPRSGQENSFHEVMVSVEQSLPKVQGCNSVQVLRHVGDALKYTFVENWQNKKSHDAHIKHLVTSGAWEQLRAMLVEAPVPILLNPISVE